MVRPSTSDSFLRTIPSGAPSTAKQKERFRGEPRVCILRGRSAILDAQPKLAELARRCGEAARTLLERGAHLVHMAFSETHVLPEHEEAQAAAPPPPDGWTVAAIAGELASSGLRAQWMLAEEQIPLYLPLLGSFDQTLAPHRAELRSYSLATVMRAYLIEDEIGRGTTRLYIEGGTPQPIGRSFARERVAELTVKRDSIYMRTLERLAPRLLPEKNRLRQILGDRELAWKPVSVRRDSSGG